jgi:hypothetical protein
LTRLLVVDDDADILDVLGRAGFAMDTSEFDAIVVRLSDAGLPPTTRLVPVIAVVDDGDAETRLRAAIAGAVRCVTRDGLVDALREVLAPDAPSLLEQQRRARVVALEALARSGEETVRHVHLTRLERGPVRTAPPAVSPLARCTVKQRELLDVIARASNVTNAAVELGTTRGRIYATLRRIAHSLNLRDTGEVLRIIGAKDAGRL